MDARSIVQVCPLFSGRPLPRQVQAFARFLARADGAGQFSGMQGCSDEGAWHLLQLAPAPLPLPSPVLLADYSTMLYVHAGSSASVVCTGDVPEKASDGSSWPEVLQSLQVSKAGVAPPRCKPWQAGHAAQPMRTAGHASRQRSTAAEPANTQNSPGTVGRPSCVNPSPSAEAPSNPSLLLCHATPVPVQNASSVSLEFKNISLSADAFERLVGLVAGAGSSDATGTVTVTLSSVTAKRQQVGRAFVAASCRVGCSRLQPQEHRTSRFLPCCSLAGPQPSPRATSFGQ